MDYLKDAREQWATIEARAWRTLCFAGRLPEVATYKTEGELREALVTPPTFKLNVPAAATQEGSSKEKHLEPNGGVICGADMAWRRDRRGNYSRPKGDQLDYPGVLEVAPVVPNDRYGSMPISGLNAQPAQVRLVDDSYTGFFELDKSVVYADFDLMQRLALMIPQKNEDGLVRPARVSMLAVKLKGEATPERLAAAQKSISAIVKSVRERHPDDFTYIARDPGDPDQGMTVRTWDQRQKSYIDAIANEKTMITFILGLMSLVVLVVIFLIFYIIVRDKTRDIGIIKAVGGSEIGGSEHLHAVWRGDRDPGRAGGGDHGGRVRGAYQRDPRVAVPDVRDHDLEARCVHV